MFIRYVHTDRDGPQSFSGERAGGLRRSERIDIGDGYVRARTRQALGNGEANAISSAGDNGNPPI